MGKDEFLDALRRELNGLPPNEIERSIAYYSEMIDDRIEDGLTEYQAVGEMEDVYTIARCIKLEQPLTTLVRSKMNSFHFPSTLTLILVILGFPIWFPLFIAAFVLILAFFIVVLSIILSLFAVVLGLGLGGIAAVIAGLFYVFVNPARGAAAIGCGFILIGVGLLLFFPALYGTKGTLVLVKLFVRWIKSFFVRKDRNY